ncbi:hypothetical protein CMQ_2453 [Grosmannia clavigera kw1407]|uniref:Uncharacterized protein n=1 Tax=Grosmannia clavigera (strain kw1407 / UAMH 11150) TaxID=655863 RepID=F0XJ79_GROCL|nr:uncharacterized protein CMQ_2453 [Grosmannia clavigera kw1407]EFX02404.1 hypothetical protein CMQ_2453 [Grosmannia clavigera kw1407]
MASQKSTEETDATSCQLPVAETDATSVEGESVAAEGQPGSLETLAMALDNRSFFGASSISATNFRTSLAQRPEREMSRVDPLFLQIGSQFAAHVSSGTQSSAPFGGRPTVVNLNSREMFLLNGSFTYTSNAVLESDTMGLGVITTEELQTTDGTAESSDGNSDGNGVIAAQFEDTV